MSWSDERVDLLKKLWSGGYTAAQIAKSLGGITRNAVIGKIHRLKLSGWEANSGGEPRRARPSADTPPLEQNNDPGRFTVGNVALEPEMAKVMDAEELEEACPDSAKVFLSRSSRKSLHELDATTCRWPHGDPFHADFSFCGATPVEGMPYCAHHASRAYQSGSQRRRAPLQGQKSKR